MIKILIIEDEAPASKKLISFLEKSMHQFEVIDVLETVEAVKIFFQNDNLPDLIYSDIELRDGNLFEFLMEEHIEVPIIFTTAYNQFWMNAFETSGIEYLLKPYSFARFEKALSKYLSLRNTKSLTDNKDLIAKLDALYKQQEQKINTYKEHLAVKSKGEIYFLKIREVMFFQADNGVICAMDSKGKKHILNQTSLMALEELLNPEDFFKINRGEIVNRHFIDKIARYTKNTVAISLGAFSLKTSQSQTASFNKWLGL